MLFSDSGLAGKTAIVTGGSRGIGAAIVTALAAEGVRVRYCYLRADEAANEHASRLNAEGRDVKAAKVDIRDPAQCDAFVESVVDETDAIDLLVNNSGIVRDNILGLLENEDIRAVIDTNIVGTFNITRAVVPHMISRRAGKIVNISSVSGLKGGRGQTNYAASKGAIDAFTRALAVELAPRNIRVNAVAPGVIETQMSEEVRARAEDEVKSRILLRRFGTGEEVAAAVTFLLSRHADYITGQVLCVDGGFKME